MMKRPSNVLLAFTMTVASSFAIWIGYLFIVQATEFLGEEIQKTSESQLKQ